MTDEDLREAAARAMGWRMLPNEHGEHDPIWQSPSGRLAHASMLPPLDWITAGALLDVCKPYENYSILIDVQDSEVVVFLYDDDDSQYFSPVNARNVIEACVLALAPQRTADSRSDIALDASSI